MGHRGLEVCQKNTEQTNYLQNSDLKTGRQRCKTPDFLQNLPPELAHLVEVWPRLPEEIRQTIYDIALDALKDAEERPVEWEAPYTDED